MMKKILSVFLFLFSVFSHAEYLTSCESSLDNPSYTRSDHLSDICWTRHGADQSNFIYWQGLWDGSKTLTPITSWDAVITAMDIEHANGWRLPTIKELAHLASPKAIDNSASPQVPGALSDFWMVQNWFNRQSVALESDLIPAGDNYILSSTYFEDVDGKKLMAININDGRLVKIAMDVNTNFDLSNVYVIKMKSGEPVWQRIISQNVAHFNGRCISIGATIDQGAENSSDIFLDDCSTVDKYKNGWLFEANTGLLRSYSGYCAEPDVVAKWKQFSLDDCKSDNARLVRSNSATAGYYNISPKDNPSLYVYGAHGDGGDGIEKYEIPLWDSISPPSRFNWQFIDIPN